MPTVRSAGAQEGERAIYDVPPVTQLVIQELRQPRICEVRTASELGEAECWRVVPVATSSEATLSIYAGHWTGDVPLLVNGAVSSEIARDMEHVARIFQTVSSGPKK